MLVLRSSTFAEDANGNEVFLAKGTQINEISDAGPEEIRDYTALKGVIDITLGWNVSFKVKHPGMPVEEIVTMDSVKLLKALDG